MAGFVLSAGLPIWINHSGPGEPSGPWQKAVYRFDTGVLFSCEAFAREIARLPSRAKVTPAADQWERIPPHPPAVRVSPDCLVQAGLMVL